MSESVDASALIADVQSLGWTLQASQAERLIAFLGLLQKWNATYNLTAVRNAAEMRAQHLTDCLAVVAPLRRQLGQGQPVKVLDVGSGGGLPGVVLAAVEPAWDVTCVDAVGKKAAFVRQVASELQLHHLHAEHARVEAMRPAAPFDLVTSRAFASLADFTRLTRHVLAPRGVWMAMKGRRPQEELSALPSNVETFHVEPLDVPGLGAERCLVWMRPK